MKYLGIAAAVIGLVLLAALLYVPTGPVSSKLANEVRLKRAPTVDLAKITDFPWSELFIFGPYQRREKVCGALNISGANCTTVAPEVIDEGGYLLVFRDGDRITHHERHARKNGDFYGSGAPNPVPRERAWFAIRERGAEGWFILEYRGNEL